MKRITLFLFLSCFVFACGPEPPSRTIGDNTFVPPEEDAGEQEEVGPPCTAETDAAMCERLGYLCGSLSDVDNCGDPRTVDSCGDPAEVCGQFETCGGSGAPGLCGCTPESDAVMCERLNYECGELEAVDNCGEARVIESCGDPADVCLPTESCGGSGVAGRCGCEGETDIQLCQVQGFNCGSYTTQDSCGRQRTIAECGPACTEPQTCGGGGQANICGCTPKSNAVLCAENEATCGELLITDDCGVERTINCGREEDVCVGTYDTCGGGAVANQCGCTPTTCAEQQIMCGPLFDGCGATIQCDGFCVQELEAGPFHACAIGSGNLRCWGRNNAGQLGTGNKTNQRNPATVTGLPAIKTVSTGANNTCAVTEAGALWCWGANNRGQVGDGTTNERLRPVPILDIASGASDVVVGDSHVCAIVNGGVKCWGWNEHGQLGNALYDFGTNVAVPTDVDDLSEGVVQLASGPAHICALLDNHDVYCWGRNRFGQVGNLELNPLLPIDAYGFENALSLDENTRVGTPVKVEGLGQIVELMAGDDYTCALDVLGKVFCWGTLTRANTPACPVDTGYLTNLGAPILMNGGVCAIFPPEGQGYPITRYTVRLVSRNGCLATPCTEAEGTCNEDLNRCELFEYPLNAVFVDRAFLAPTELAVPQAVETFGAGANHLCVVVDEPDVDKTNIRCLGRNNQGQIGDGSNNNWAFTVPIVRGADSNIVRGTAVAPGTDHSCALVSDSNVKCWGSNQSLQIGNDAMSNQQTYVPFDVKLVYEP